MKCPPAQYLVLAVTVVAAAATFGPWPDQVGDPAGPGADPLPPFELVSPGVSRDAHLRSAAKAIVAADAAAGRLTLTGAAALFRELDRLPPAMPVWDGPGPHPALPGATAEERLCRQVIAWEGQAPAARLGDNLQAALAGGATVRLPDAAALPPVRGYLDRAWSSLTPPQQASITDGRPNDR